MSGSVENFSFRTEISILSNAMAHRNKSVTLVWTEILDCRITRLYERGRILDV